MHLIKEHLLRIKDATLRAVDPKPAVKRFLAYKNDQIRIGKRFWTRNEGTRVLLIAVGKASIPMAEAASEILGEALTTGIVVTKYAHAAGHTLPSSSIRIIEAGHPVPDSAGLTGARAIADLLSTTTSQDRVLLLVSGGASALLPLPVNSVSLTDLQTTTNLLLRAGATINEINAVRKHLSRLKGGQLARLAMPAPVAALILSDVIGDPLDVIASGLTAPDPTTYVVAKAVLSRFGLWTDVPASVRAHLECGIQNRVAETPKPGDGIFDNVGNVLIGSNRLAALAAKAEAEALGYQTSLLTTFMEGEAREIAKATVSMAKGIRAHGDPIAPPACLVWGGETTVTVRGKGKGGRNQELALASALALEGLPDVGLLALATDGTDGPTDAAGAIVDGQTAQIAREAGWDIESTLLDNNAYPLLDDVGALLRTGPTGTNVNDVTVILVR